MAHACPTPAHATWSCWLSHVGGLGLARMLLGATPMASVESIRFNSQLVSWEGLVRLARAEPESARKYLTEVQSSLRALRSDPYADALEEVIRAPDLVAGITTSPATAGLFPANVGEVPNLQWSSDREQPWKTAFVQGELRKDPNNVAELVTPAGRRYTIRSGFDPNTGRTSRLQLDRMLFVGEPQVVVKGTLASDGASLKLEAAAPLRPGFDTFEAGRVMVDGDDVTLDTMRADVLITNPELKSQLRYLPSLGVLLPGEAVRNADGRYVYEGSPPEFFALVGFIEKPGQDKGTTPRAWDVDPADSVYGLVPAGKRFAVGNMAQSNQTFRAKPVVLPDDASEQAKVNSFAIMWVSGRFVENRDASGAIVASDPYRYFEATHITVPVASMLSNETDAVAPVSATHLNAADTDRAEPAVLWSSQ
jgi:hypothetical protein